MFDFFRRHIKTIVLPLFLLIAVGFVFTGAGGYLGALNDQTILAKGRGFEVTETELSAQVRRTLEQQPHLDAKIFDSPQIRRALLEQLVNDRVLALAAQAFRVHIGPERWLHNLLHDPRWAQLRSPDGSVDKKMFETLARSQGLSSEAFLQRLSADLAVQDVYQSIAQTSFVSQSLVRSTLDAFAQRRAIQTLSFAAQAYLEQVQPSLTEAKAYYEQHPQDYQSPERADIEYLSLTFDTVAKGIKIDEAALKAYYEQNAQGLQGQEERKASHILIASDTATSSTGHAAARKQAQALLQVLRDAPERFAQLAQQHSQDTESADNGGDLGYFPRGIMPKPLEDAVFDLAPGAISEVVETDFGYHIVRLDAIRQAQIEPFSALRPQIEEALRKQQASQVFAEQAEQFNTLVYEQPDSLEAAATALGLTVQTAQNLSPAGPDTPGLDSLLSNAAFLQTIFDNAKTNLQKNTEVLDLGNQHLVAARVLRFEPATTLPFDTVQPQVEAALKLQKAVELAKEAGQAVLAQAQTNPKGDFDWNPVITVSRVQNTDTSSIPALVLDKVLSVPAQQLPVVEGFDLGAQGYWLVKVLEVLPAALDAEQNTTLGNNYQAAWQNAQEQAYLRWLRDYFQVEILLES